MFDLSISLGNLMTIVSFIIGGVSFVYAIKSDTRVLATRLGNLEEDVKKMSDVLVELAKTDGRMNLIEDRILAQGKRLDEATSVLHAMMTSQKVYERKVDARDD